MHAESTVTHSISVWMPPILNAIFYLLLPVYCVFIWTTEIRFLTCNDHLKKLSSMTAAIHNPCLLFSSEVMFINCHISEPWGDTFFQINVTLHLSDISFLVEKEHTSKRSICKPEMVFVQSKTSDQRRNFHSQQMRCQITSACSPEGLSEDWCI